MTMALGFNFWCLRLTKEMSFTEKNFKYLHVTKKTKKKEKGAFHDFNWHQGFSFWVPVKNLELKQIKKGVSLQQKFIFKEKSEILSFEWEKM